MHPALVCPQCGAAEWLHALEQVTYPRRVKVVATPTGSSILVHQEQPATIDIQFEHATTTGIECHYCHWQYRGRDRVAQLRPAPDLHTQVTTTAQALDDGQKGPTPLRHQIKELVHQMMYTKPPAPTAHSNLLTRMVRNSTGKDTFLPGDMEELLDVVATHLHTLAEVSAA